MNKLYLGAAGQDEEREGPVEMNCIIGFDIPQIRHIASCFIFLEIDILKFNDNIFETSKIEQ